MDNNSVNDNGNNNTDGQQTTASCSKDKQPPISQSTTTNLNSNNNLNYLSNIPEDLPKNYAFLSQQLNQPGNYPIIPPLNQNPYLNIPYNLDPISGYNGGGYLNNNPGALGPYGTNPIVFGSKGKKSSLYDPQIHGVITKLADEKVRKTFGSIEMVIDAFSSISMILESTYSALDGSIRTITGMADHLIFVRNHLAQIALFPRLAQAVYDFFKWLLKLLGLGKLLSYAEFGGTVDTAWGEALANGSATITDLMNGGGGGDPNDPKRSSPLMPIFVFFSLILGTPYIMWRILGAKGRLPTTNLPEWTLSKGRHFTATSLVDYKRRNPNELNLTKGLKLFVKPESVKPDSKWLIASTTYGTPMIGYVPANFVKLQFV